MTLRILMVAFVLLAVGHSSLAQGKTIKAEQLNSGIVYGHGYAFAVTAPQGWVLDTRSGSGQGLAAVFYPQGSSWQYSETVMYAHAAFKDNGTSRTLQQIIQNDLHDLKSETPKMVVTQANGVLTNAKHQAVVKYFSCTPGGNWEAVAYIDERRTVTELVLSARTPARFTASLPAFRQLVSSYWFVTDKVEVVRPAAHRSP